MHCSAALNHSTTTTASRSARMTMMLRSVALLCLWLLGVVTSQAEVLTTTTPKNDGEGGEKQMMYHEALFNLNPFSIDFTSTHHEFFATGESSPFSMIKFEIATITATYLEDWLNALLPKTPIGGKYKVSSVRLQVSSFRPVVDQGGRLLQGQTEQDNRPTWAFRAEVYGIVKCLEPIEEQHTASRDQVEHILNSLTDDAFEGSLDEYKKMLAESDDVVLMNLVELTVTTNIPGTYEEPPQQTLPPNIVDTIEGEGEQQDGGGGSSKSWGAKEYTLTILMVVFALAAFGCLYVYMTRERRERKEQKRYIHYLDDMQDRNLNSASSDYLSRSVQSPSDSKGGTEEEEQGDEEIVPIAAPTNNSSKNTNQDEDGTPVTPRRYINPASPFEVLYGAAFRHQDQQAVDQARRTKRRSSKKSRRRRSSTDGIRPMLSIAEEELSAGNSYSTSSQSTDMPMLSTWIARLTGGYFDASPSKKMENNPETEALASPTGVAEELGVVYRDFPRHDGTPCLMYSPSEDESIEVSEGPMAMMQEVYIDEGSYHSTGSMLSLDSTSNESSGKVDNFVLQLEHLMILRQKQYQERQRMEQERREFRSKKHLDKPPIVSRRSSHASSASSVTTAEELGFIEQDHNVIVKPKAVKQVVAASCDSPAADTQPTLESESSVHSSASKQKEEEEPIQQQPQPVYRFEGVGL